MLPGRKEKDNRIQDDQYREYPCKTIDEIIVKCSFIVTGWIIVSVKNYKSADYKEERNEGIKLIDNNV